MHDKFIEDSSFEKKDYSVDGSTFEIAEYDNCRFIQCNFAGADLSTITFSDCLFDGCDISMAVLRKTGFRNVQFQHCKSLGLHFDDCDPFLFEASFKDCILNMSFFFKTKLAKTTFSNCQLREVDFAEADLSLAVFSNCELTGAIFDRTNLEKADLRTAHGYSIDPENNNIKKAKFSLAGIAGLLDKYKIEIH